MDKKEFIQRVQNEFRQATGAPTEEIIKIVQGAIKRKTEVQKQKKSKALSHIIQTRCLNKQTKIRV